MDTRSFTLSLATATERLKKKHSLACRTRYTKWLDEQQEKRKALERESGDVRPEVPAEHPTGGRRVTGKRPFSSADEGGDAPMGVEPGGVAVEAEVEPELPRDDGGAGDELMDDVDRDEGAMDVDQMETTVNEVEKLLVATSEEATREFWVRGLDERVSGGRIWFQVEAFGSAFWRVYPRGLFVM